MFKRSTFNIFFVLLKLICDSVMIFTAFLLAYFIRQEVGPAFQPGLNVYLNYLLYVVILWIIIFIILGLYRNRKGFFVELDEIFGMLHGSLIGLAGVIIISFIFDEFIYSRRLIFYAWPISLAFLCLSRIVIFKFELMLISRGIGSLMAVIIGQGDIARALANRIKRMPSLGYKLVGNAATLSELEQLVKKQAIDEIFIADPKYQKPGLLELAAKYGININIVPGLYEMIAKPVKIDELDDIPLISIKERNIPLRGRIVKRSMDIVVAVLCFMVFLPIILIIAVLIKSTSSGPVLYSQARIGRNGKIFNLYKFRTMQSEAENTTGPVLASTNDPRKTVIGGFLRRVHLDELPQLYNVIKGDMSLVGPRPERPYFADQYRIKIPGYDERNNVRPGLAGFAQISGAYDLPMEEKVKYDFYYIENWSVLLDIKLIIRMLFKAFSLKNSH